MRRVFLLLMIVGFAYGAEGPVLPKAPIDTRDLISLQRGARTFINYCLGCHSAQAMRYNRLKDLGLTDDQIVSNFIFNPEIKVADLMRNPISKEEGTKWFGIAPPDLSVIARARGANYLYAYLRSFYRDDTRPSGWNNKVFVNGSMPNPFWALQGHQILEVEKKDGEEHKELKLVSPGRMTYLRSDGTIDTKEFDSMVADLVNYMVYMGEPAILKRKTIGYVVLLFLIGLLLPTVYLLKREYWKDVPH